MEATPNLPDSIRQEINTLSPIVVRAQTTLVNTAADYEAAAGIHAEAKRAIKRVGDLLKPMVDAAFAAHRAATKLRADLMAPFEDAARITDANLTGWRREQKRIADELNRQQEAERQKAAALARQKADEERLAVAEQAEKSGDTTIRDMMLDQLGKDSTSTSQNPMVSVMPAASIPKVAGLSIRTYYRHEVESLDLLIEAAGKNPEWRSFLTADDSALRKYSEATKAQGLVPGVRFFETEGTSQKT